MGHEFRHGKDCTYKLARVRELQTRNKTADTTERRSSKRGVAADEP